VALAARGEPLAANHWMVTSRTISPLMPPRAVATQAMTSRSWACGARSERDQIDLVQRDVLTQQATGGARLDQYILMPTEAPKHDEGASCASATKGIASIGSPPPDDGLAIGRGHSEVRQQALPRDHRTIGRSPPRGNQLETVTN
jgi:hypothetical protein